MINTQQHIFSSESNHMYFYYQFNINLKTSHFTVCVLLTLPRKQLIYQFLRVWSFFTEVTIITKYLNDNTLHFYCASHWIFRKISKTVNWQINNNYFQEHIEKNSTCYSVWLTIFEATMQVTTSSTAVLPPL